MDEHERDIDAAFSAIEAELIPGRLDVIERLIAAHIARQTPVRWVRQAVRAELGRVGFADGVVVLARGRRPADLARLAVQLENGARVVLLASRRGVAAVSARVNIGDGREIMVDVVGLDQPE